MVRTLGLPPPELAPGYSPPRCFRFNPLVSKLSWNCPPPAVPSVPAGLLTVTGGWGEGVAGYVGSAAQAKTWGLF